MMRLRQIHAMFNFEPGYTGSLSEKLDGEFTQEGIERDMTKADLLEAARIMCKNAAEVCHDDRNRDAIWRMYEEFRNRPDAPGFERLKLELTHQCTYDLQQRKNKL